MNIQLNGPSSDSSASLVDWYDRAYEELDSLRGLYYPRILQLCCEKNSQYLLSQEDVAFSNNLKAALHFLEFNRYDIAQCNKDVVCYYLSFVKNVTSINSSPVSAQEQQQQLSSRQSNQVNPHLRRKEVSASEIPEGQRLRNPQENYATTVHQGPSLQIVPKSLHQLPTENKEFPLPSKLLDRKKHHLLGHETDQIQEPKAGQAVDIVSEMLWQNHAVYTGSPNTSNLQSMPSLQANKMYMASNGSEAEQEKKKAQRGKRKSQKPPSLTQQTQKTSLKKKQCQNMGKTTKDISRPRVPEALDIIPQLPILPDNKIQMIQDDSVAVKEKNKATSRPRKTRRVQKCDLDQPKLQSSPTNMHEMNKPRGGSAIEMNSEMLQMHHASESSQMNGNVAQTIQHSFPCLQLENLTAPRAGTYWQPYASPSFVSSASTPFLQSSSSVSPFYIAPPTAAGSFNHPETHVPYGKYPQASEHSSASIYQNLSMPQPQVRTSLQPVSSPFYVCSPSPPFSPSSVLFDSCGPVPQHSSAGSAKYHCANSSATSQHASLHIDQRNLSVPVSYAGKQPGASPFILPSPPTQSSPYPLSMDPYSYIPSSSAAGNIRNPETFDWVSRNQHISSPEESRCSDLHIHQKDLPRPPFQFDVFSQPFQSTSLSPGSLNADFSFYSPSTSAADNNENPEVVEISQTEFANFSQSCQQSSLHIQQKDLPIHVPYTEEPLPIYAAFSLLSASSDPASCFPPASAAADAKRLEAPPLLDEFTCMEMNQKTDDEMLPVKRLCEVVKSMSPAALNAAVEDIRAVINMDFVAGIDFSLYSGMKCDIDSIVPDLSSCPTENDLLKRLSSQTTNIESPEVMGGKRPRIEIDVDLLEEIKDINQDLTETVVEQVSDCTERASRARFGEGTVLRCSYSPAGLGGNFSNQSDSSWKPFPFASIWLFVPASYPDSSLIVIRESSSPLRELTEPETPSDGLEERFNLLLRTLSEPVSLRKMVTTWDHCAHSVFMELVMRRRDTWKKCYSAV